MKTKIYSVFDSKAEAFGPPFFLPLRAMALRAFTDLMNDTSLKMHLHREDYVLYEIGEFDDAVGAVSPYPQNVNLGIAPSMVPAVEGLKPAEPSVVGDRIKEIVADTVLS